MRNSYTILKDDFPGFMAELAAFGVTEPMLEAYLEDLDAAVLRRGPLTYFNFSEVLFNAILELFGAGTHNPVYQAMFDMLGDDLYEILAGKLPAKWVPLRDAVKESLLGSVFEGSIGTVGLNPALVYLTLFNGERSYGPFLVGNEGDFSVTGLFYPGSYLLKAAKPGYLSDYRVVAVDESGTRTVTDFLRLQAGDIDGNGVVNIADLARLGQAWGTVRGAGGYEAAADFNGDGIIDIYDAVALTRNWMQTSFEPVL